MTGRQSQAVSLGVRLVREQGSTVSAAARESGANVTSVRRALRTAGVPPLARGRRPKDKETPARG